MHAHESCMHVAVRVLHSSAFINNYFVMVHMQSKKYYNNIIITTPTR